MFCDLVRYLLSCCFSYNKNLLSWARIKPFFRENVCFYLFRYLSHDKPPCSRCGTCCTVMTDLLRMILFFHNYFMLNGRNYVLDFSFLSGGSKICIQKIYCRNKRRGISHFVHK